MLEPVAVTSALHQNLERMIMLIKIDNKVLQMQNQTVAHQCMTGTEHKV